MPCKEEEDEVKVHEVGWGFILADSNNFLYMGIYKKKSSKKNSFFRDPGGIRTHDPQLRRLLLYPAELRDQHA